MTNSVKDVSGNWALAYKKLKGDRIAKTITEDDHEANMHTNGEVGYGGLLTANDRNDDELTKSSFDQSNSRIYKKIKHFLRCRQFRKQGYVVRSNSKFRTRWDMMIIILSFWNCIILPIHIAFEPEFLDSS